MTFDLQNIISNVSTQLLAYNRLLKTLKIEPYIDFKLQSQDFQDKFGLDSTLKKILNPSTPVIYKLNCKDLTERMNLISRYQDFNKSNSTLTRGKDRLNISRFNNTGSDTLYLGSTMTDLKTRIKQHLGGGNFRTYSLHLSKWDKSLKYSLDIQSFKIYSTTNSVLDRNFIELVEQALWEETKPVFGKKSGL